MSVITEGKTLLEAIENAKNELKTEKIIYKTFEEKNGIFKSNYKVEAISYQELLEELKDYLKAIIEPLNIAVNFETSIEENQLNIIMHSDNNSLLIGRNGATLASLEILCRTKIKIEWNASLKIIIDVENYRDRRIEALERLAIETAKEVKESKISASLENMNSYERRIIHNKLSKFKGVSTTSEGEEPNRHIVIKAE